ncbi:MAG TPA: isoprenylcysteine carboxylmethyltransferase family protein [Planctomycetota bacterium]|nr:isoprenylcysteine carboxylmethyltransferase family protein [Planctomycetota bacterium]
MRLLLKNLLFMLVVPGSVGGWVPALLVSDTAPRDGAWRVAAAAVFALAAAILAWCVLDFARRGRGTPLPFDPPRRVVATGPYRWVRNPMYLAVMTAIAGWGVLVPSGAVPIYAACVALCFQAMVVLYEEPHLEREFGDDYRAYRARVPRWLPRPPRG